MAAGGRKIGDGYKDMGYPNYREVVIVTAACLHTQQSHDGLKIGDEGSHIELTGFFRTPVSTLHRTQ